ncbi:hypothetical protein ACQKO5_13870 [Novosphingobium subterraneum]|uniref:hypothetical protein n=1 Tax=Novosphingobium subterraneum TaxID=48936 RepID=UPI003D02FB8D
MAEREDRMRQRLKRLAIVLAVWLSFLTALEAWQFQKMFDAQSECEALASRAESPSSLPAAVANAAPRYDVRGCFGEQRDAKTAQKAFAIFFLVFPILLFGISSLIIWIYRGFYPISS